MGKRTHNSELIYDKNINTITGDVNQNIDGLVQQLDAIGPDTLGFAFVDPPGIQLEFETLKKLSRNTRVDLLINFPLGMNIKRQIWHQRQKSPDSNSTFDKYFGTKQWRDLIERDFIGYRLLQLYKEQLMSLGYNYVGDEHAVKNRGVSLYMLVFASKNPKGKEFWEKVTQVAPSGQRKLF